MRVLKVCSVCLLMLGLVAGCSKGSDSAEAAPAASQGNEAPPAPLTGTTPMTKLTDGQIAEILETVDTAEIEQAQLALEKASNADIRSFATHMVQQHTASKQSGEALASRSNMKLDSSPITTNLRAKHEQVMQKLKAVDAAGFDSLYHTSQVDQHTETLAMIDDQLIPAVNDSALRDHLANARGMVQQHLEQAQKLRP